MFGSALAWQRAPANQIRRIYVEPFTTQAGCEKFREGVITELRKLNSQPAVGQVAAQRDTYLDRLLFD
jgi:hypothetical protein